MPGYSELVMLFFSEAMIDVNLPQFEYLANHLQPEECRRLMIALHYKEHVSANTLQAKEKLIPKDVPCLKLLLHWNSIPGEGLGQTHEVLCYHLRQMGHQNLADWLSQSVYHNLANDLNRSLLINPFMEAANEEKLNVVSTREPLEEEDENNLDIWTTFDTICCILIVFLGSFILVLIIQFFCQCRPQNEKEDR